MIAEKEKAIRMKEEVDALLSTLVESNYEIITMKMLCHLDL